MLRPIDGSVADVCTMLQATMGIHEYYTWSKRQKGPRSKFQCQEQSETSMWYQNPDHASRDTWAIRLPESAAVTCTIQMNTWVCVFLDAAWYGYTVSTTSRTFSLLFPATILEERTKTRCSMHTWETQENCQHAKERERHFKLHQRQRSPSAPSANPCVNPKFAVQRARPREPLPHRRGFLPLFHWK